MLTQDGLENLFVGVIGAHSATFIQCFGGPLVLSVLSVCLTTTKIRCCWIDVLEGCNPSSRCRGKRVGDADSLFWVGVKFIITLSTALSSIHSNVGSTRIPRGEWDEPASPT